MDTKLIIILDSGINPAPYPPPPSNMAQYPPLPTNTIPYPPPTSKVPAPPPYSPSPAGQNLFVQCRVCQHVINVPQGSQSRVVKCGSCHEATVSSSFVRLETLFLMSLFSKHLYFKTKYRLVTLYLNFYYSLLLRLLLVRNMFAVHAIVC